jgi:hypothetical protein
MKEKDQAMIILLEIIHSSMPSRTRGPKGLSALLGKEPGTRNQKPGTFFKLL